MVPKNVSCFINMNIIAFNNFKNFIKEEPSFFRVMYLSHEHDIDDFYIEGR